MVLGQTTLCGLACVGLSQLLQICLFLDSNLLCPLPDLDLLHLLPQLKLDLPNAWTEHALPTADSSSDHRSFCQAVFCGPAVRFPIGFVRLFHHSYSCDIATLLYIPHKHLTPVLFLQVGNWHCVPAWAGAEVNIAKWKQWVFLVIGVQQLRRNNRIYCADSRGRHLACLTSSLRVPCQSWKQVFILNITITQQEPTTNVTYKGSSLKKKLFLGSCSMSGTCPMLLHSGLGRYSMSLHVRGQVAIELP